MKLHLYKNINSMVLHRWNFISDYPKFIEEHKEQEVITLDNANFKYQNNVYSDFIFNLPNLVNIDPGVVLTYLIVEDNDKYSSWYIAGTFLIRGGQYDLKLKRDLLNDYMEYIKDNDFNVYRSFFNNQMKVTNNILPHLLNEDENLIGPVNDLLKDRFEIQPSYADDVNGTWSIPNTWNYSQSELNPNDLGDTSCYIQADRTHGVFLIYFDDNIVSLSGTQVGEEIYPLSATNINLEGVVNPIDFVNEGYAMGSESDYNKGFNVWKHYGSKIQAFSYSSDYRYPSSIYLSKLSSSIGYLALIPRFFGRDRYSIEDHYLDIVRFKSFFGNHIVDIQYVPWFFQFSFYGKTLAHWFYNHSKKSSKDSLVPILQFSLNQSTDGYKVIYYDSDVPKSMEKDLIGKKVVLHHTRCEIVTPSQLNKAKFNYFKASVNGDSPWFYLYYKFAPYQIYFGFSFYNNCYYNLYGNNTKELFFTPSEDLTLDLTSSEFQNYQLENKNYSQIFNRQMAMNDKVMAINYTKNTVNTAISTVGNVAGDAVSGKLGKAIGEGVSGVSSIITSSADWSAYEETRRAQGDIFNMQVDNIKCRADTPLIKGNFTPQNLGWFVIDFYTNDDSSIEEYKKVLKNKGILFNYNNIKLKDMYKEIDVTTTINSDGIKPYIACEMISNNNDNSNYFDNFLWNEINKELAKGIYFTEESFKEIIKEN